MPRQAEPADPIAARELAIWATTSSADLYRQTIKPVCANLARRQLAGTYDAAKSAQAWEHVADAAAKAYLKEFTVPIASGDWDYSIFSKSTRKLAAAEIAPAYEELTADILAELKADRENRKRWTLSAIKSANDDAGRYFFSRDTMRFFGDTMRNFGVHFEGGKIYVVRLKAGSKPPAGHGVGERREFNPQTGEIGTPLRG